MKFDSAQIARATGGIEIVPGTSGPIRTDSRTIESGVWFLALVGERFDGHAYLAEVSRREPIGCVVSGEVPTVFSSAVVRVRDTTRALQDLGRAARDRLLGPVIGLTGSSGKTTTRALVSLALAECGVIHQTVGNLNNHLGVPMTLLAAPEDAAATVVEMGTSGPGEIAVLADIARPNVRLLVNVGPAHLQELSGLDGVAREKGTLFATARPGDVLCVNLDDPRICALPRPDGTRVVTYGARSDATIRLVRTEVDPVRLCTRAAYKTAAGEIAVLLPAPGRYMAHNGAAALAVAFALDLDLHRAASHLERYEPVGMRMKIEPLPGGAIALNDAYNANPTSMEASLRVLCDLPGRRIAVLGDMLELGSGEDEWHRRVAAMAGALHLDLVVFFGARMGRAAADCVGAGEVWVDDDADSVARRLKPSLRAGDRVLFKGSRGSRVERILQGLQAEASASGDGK